jgi:hypothetical protein
MLLTVINNLPGLGKLTITEDTDKNVPKIIKNPECNCCQTQITRFVSFCFGFFSSFCTYTGIQITFLFNILLFKQRTIYYRSRKNLVSGTFRVYKWEVQTSITGHWFCGGRQWPVLRILFRAISRSSVLKVLQEN